MKELIKIYNHKDRSLVNARELHVFLESKQEFANWIKNRISSYGFIEYQDYLVFDKAVKNPNGGRPMRQYGLTIDMAKELCMLENNQKGKQARKYFIEREKVANGYLSMVPGTYAGALELAAKQARQIELQSNKIQELAPKAELMDRVLDSDTNIDIGQVAKILDLPYGRNTLFKKLREMGILFKNRNEPMQEYINRGYFLLKEKMIDRENHPSFPVIKVLVTQKGLEWLAKRLEVIVPDHQLATIE